MQEDWWETYKHRTGDRKLVGGPTERRRHKKKGKVLGKRERERERRGDGWKKTATREGDFSEGGA